LFHSVEIYRFFRIPARLVLGAIAGRVDCAFSNIHTPPPFRLRKCDKIVPAHLLTWRSIDENSTVENGLCGLHRLDYVDRLSSSNEEANAQPAGGYLADGGWEDGFDSLQLTLHARAQDLWRPGAV
jgi:hypothetical protein